MTVEVADVELTSGDWPKGAAPLRYIALRMTPMQGSLFSDGSSVRYFAVVTNRAGDAGEIVEWHRHGPGVASSFSSSRRSRATLTSRKGPPCRASWLGKIPAGGLRLGRRSGRRIQGVLAWRHGTISTFLDDGAMGPGDRRALVARLR